MVINTNMSAQSSARLLGESTSMLSKSLARLSSGYKVNSPEDDVAGLAVSTRFQAQLSRISAANSNVGNAISFSQTQDGFLSKVGKALNRMSELTILAQDATKSDTDRALYNGEFQQLAAYITDLATKDFNGASMFNGSQLDITIDSEGAMFQMAGVDLGNATYTSIATADVSTIPNATAALATIRSVIGQLAADRAAIGANLARLHSTSDQLGVLKDNLTEANSRIVDVDVAEESTQFARYNILVQAGTAMLAQANAVPQSVLRLLQ
jgi:flagellin